MALDAPEIITTFESKFGTSIERTRSADQQQLLNSTVLVLTSAVSGDIAADVDCPIVVIEAAVGGIGNGGDAIAVPPPTTPFWPESIPRRRSDQITSDSCKLFLKKKIENHR